MNKKKDIPVKVTPKQKYGIERYMIGNFNGLRFGIESALIDFENATDKKYSIDAADKLTTIVDFLVGEMKTVVAVQKQIKANLTI